MKNSQALGRMELLVSRVLQVGVFFSASVILLGLALFYLQAYESQSLTTGSYHAYANPAYSFPHTIPAIISSLQAGSGVAFIELGILLLILTPIIRVITSVFVFARRHNRRMTVVTLIVFLVLVSSFLLGLRVQ